MNSSQQSSPREKKDAEKSDPFSAYYEFERVLTSQDTILMSTLPDSVKPDGEEVVEDGVMDARWNLYRSCEYLREKGKKQSNEEGSEKEDPNEQIDGVLQSLVDARSELDVVRDVITVLEDQQQFLSMMHIPHSAVQHAAKRDGLIRQGRKKAQMHSIARRLRSGVDTLRQKFCDNVQFFEDVTYLKKRWLVRECERVGHSFGEDCVLIDISMGVEDDFEWLRDAKKSLGKHKFVLSSSDDTGEVCGLFQDPESDTGEEKVVVGREEIDRILKRLQHMRSWTLICRVLEAESEDLSNLESLRGIIHPDVQRAVMALAHRMLPKHGTVDEQDMCSDPHMKYVSDFYQSDICASLFEKKALLTLQNAMAWHHVPVIIQQTTTTQKLTFLEQLCKWMLSASMWYDAARLISGRDCMSSPLIDYIRVSAERVTCLPATMHVLTGENTPLASVVIQEDYSMSWAGDHSRVGRLQVRQLLENNKNNSFVSIEYS